MYSKDKGITRREAFPASGARTPSYRQAAPARVQVPPNYSGHAIVDGEERPLGSPSAWEENMAPTSELAAAERPIPRFEGLPRVSELGDGRRHPLRTLPASFTVPEETETQSQERSGIQTEARSSSPTESAPPSKGANLGEGSPPAPIRSLLSNGLGLEELLLLGLMLFLLREGEGEERGDLDETVILLGLLLLLG